MRLMRDVINRTWDEIDAATPEITTSSGDALVSRVARRLGVSKWTVISARRGYRPAPQRSGAPATRPVLDPYSGECVYVSLPRLRCLEPAHA